jgi:hypothetical protein
LLGVGDVLPGTPAADTEVRAAGLHTMWRRTHHLEKGCGARTPVIEGHAHPLAGNREGNGDDLAAMTSHSIAGRVEVLDVEDDLSHTRVPNLTQ